tara:strand:+ start:429 stop:842 length:414 start_codon:yes stop_codon:yes gene_type:complete
MFTASNIIFHLLCIILTAVVSPLVFKRIKHYNNKTLEWQKKFNVSRRIKDENSGYGIYWIVTMTLILVFSASVHNGINEFYQLSLGAFLLLLIISIPIYLFKKHIGFAKILCHTTIIIITWIALIAMLRVMKNIMYW